MESSREEIAKLLKELSTYPDFDLLPIPEKLCKELNIPFTPAKSLSVREQLVAYKKSQAADYQSFEIRESDGIIREFKPLDETKLIVCKPEEVEQYLTTNQTDGETAEQPRQNQGIPTESNEITLQA